MDKQSETKKIVTFDDTVLEKIAGKTASEVDGVLSLQGNLIDNLSDRLTAGDRPHQESILIWTISKRRWLLN